MLPIIKGYVRKILYDKTKIDDVVQGCVVRILSKQEYVMKREEVAKYLVKAMVKNFILDKNREHKRYQEFINRIRPEEIKIERHSNIDEQRAFIANNLHLLTGRCKEAFTLKMTTGMSINDVAKTMGISQPAASKAMKKAKNIFRSKLMSGDI